MSSALNVNLYLYPSTIHFQGLSNSQIEQAAQNVSTNLVSSTLYRSFYVNPLLFEYCNRRYSEKQVKRIDENFYDYSLGTKYHLNAPPQKPPKKLRYLIQKFFSGDVSGDIGETLFAYFLTSEMQIPPFFIGHTRPEKRKSFLSPDFIVWDNSFNLSSLLNRANYSLPILGEVKGFTGPIDANRIEHGLRQLKRIIGRSRLIGLLFLAVRNQVRQGYDAYIVKAEWK